MRKHPLRIDWTIVENDADWERQCALLQPDNERTNRHRFLTRYLWCVAVLLLLFVVAGDWWRRTRQAGAPSDNQVSARVTADQTRLAVQDAGLQRVQPAHCDPLVDSSLHTVAFQGDQAVAHVITHTETGAPAYRQTYFYRCTDQGWQRTAAPDSTQWGAEQSLETPFFVYHFRQNDAAAVTAVAPQIDALYPLLRQNVGLLTAFAGEKLAIEVNVTETPRYILPQFGAPTRIRVSSPALYVAPVELTDTELLAQSIVLPLLSDVLAQAKTYHAIDSSWQPLLDGLYLWQLWDLDLPLADWREEVVTWVYTDLPTSRPDQGVVLPARYPALCAAHKLWLPSPTLINIPLMCVELAWEDFLLPPWGRYEPLTHLNQLIVPLRPGEYLEEPDSLLRGRHPGQKVALATLIEYAVATYGRDRLPALVAGLGQHESWETLLPAVYGVSAAEFEAGWQNYLVVHYRMGK